MAALPALSLQNALKDRNEFHILVVGRNGHGKTSLINKLCGGKLKDEVKRGPHPMQALVKSHPFKIKTHPAQIGDTTVYFHDTRGFSDPEIPNYTQVLNGIYEEKLCFDVVLICHKLYEPFDKTTIKSLPDLRNFLGDDLIDKTIIVCTFGDECKQRSDANTYSGLGEGQDVIKLKMILKSRDVQMKIVKHLCPDHRESFDDESVCITSGKEDNLPTPPNWKGELCKLIERKSTGELCNPQPFVNWYIRKRGTIVAGSAGVGAVIGAGIGSVVPGIGTAIGAGIGALIGLFGGGSAGGIASVAGERLTQPTRHS